MKRIHTILIAITLFLFGTFSNASVLSEYVTKDDASFKSQVISENENYTLIKMTSQTWKNIEWNHNIAIFTPKECLTKNTAILYIATNKANTETTIEAVLCKQIANAAKLPVVIVDGMPNQPLFDKNEDDLIAYTFAKMLETGENDWPLLLPMTKAASKTMDVVQKYTKGEIKDFIVSGISKRGWTTWLAAAAEPKRTRALVPIVYDNLNLVAQMKQQVLYFDGFSDKISPYQELNIENLLESEKGKQLASIVDPWCYKNIITMPKFIICGSNDPYWTVDSLNIYWNDLIGKKYVIYFENAGHDLGLMSGNPIMTLLKFTDIFKTVAVSAATKTYPDIKWNYQVGNNCYRLNVSSDDKIESAVLWKTTSQTRDFRNAVWSQSEMTLDNGKYTYKIDRPESGYTAIFANITIKKGDITFPASTQMKVILGKKSSSQN